MKTVTLRPGFTAGSIPEKTADFMRGRTFHENDRIALADLALLKILHYNYDHETVSGELVVLGSLAEEVLTIFAELYDGGYEIEKVRLCDWYEGDDEMSMADNNSSAFNYRVVADTDTLSLHALGRAIDIDPLYNPYIVGEKCMPANGTPYMDRSADFPHKIDHESLCFKVFSAHGWLWGGDWTTEKDYQHFYKPESSTLRRAVKSFRSMINKNARR